MDFAGRNVLLTGVGREGQVGEAVALAFAQQGARLFLVDHQLSTAQARADDLHTAGFTADAFGADLSNVAAVSSLSERIAAATTNSLHAVVHLAGGFAMSGSVADSDPDIWARQFSINATTAYLTARAFIPMLRSTRGALVFFASEAALPGAQTAGKSAYAAAKGAVVTLMQSVAQEEREHGVRANAVAPTSIRTAANLASMDSGTAYVSREEVAGVVLWLCSDAARVVTGQLVRVR